MKKHISIYVFLLCYLLLPNYLHIFSLLKRISNPLSNCIYYFVYALYLPTSYVRFSSDDTFTLQPLECVPGPAAPSRFGTTSPDPPGDYVMHCNSEHSLFSRISRFTQFTVEWYRLCVVCDNGRPTARGGRDEYRFIYGRSSVCDRKRHVCNHRVDIAEIKQKSVERFHARWVFICLPMAAK